MALNPKSKLTLQCVSNPTILGTLQTSTTMKDTSDKLNVVSEARSGG